MTTGGLLQTRSNLSRIVDTVMHGEEHVILKHNIPVARIVPIEETLLKQTKELIKRTKAIRHASKTVSVADLSSWKDEGRHK